MRHAIHKHSYRLTSGSQKILTLGRTEKCGECKKEYKTGTYSKYQQSCPVCMKGREQEQIALGRRQILYVTYLLQINERQSDLVNGRKQGRNGIAIDNDLEALEWQILEYRRFRIMQRLGMKPEFTPKTLRQRAKSAIKLINEIHEFNFDIRMRSR